MFVKNSIRSYLLLSIFIINLAILVINVDDWTPDIKELKLEEKIGYNPSLAVTREETKLENSVNSEIASSADSLSNKPSSMGYRSKTQSEYSTTNWVDTRWKYRKNLTIDNTKVDANLDDFPVLIDLIDSDLKSDAQVSGGDIFFTDSDGNKLDHEIEIYQRHYSSSQVRLVAWVKVNLSSSQNTVISMFYGNPTAVNQENPTNVWESNFRGVWHLEESSSGLVGEFLDSTSYGNGGQGGEGNSTCFPVQVTGKIGNGQDFDGDDDIIGMGNTPSYHLDRGAYQVSTLKYKVESSITFVKRN
ncbi:MAG: DUF2341 domain-containing protein [Candidatus Hodarchaeales archaeon]